MRLYFATSGAGSGTGFFTHFWWSNPTHASAAQVVLANDGGGTMSVAVNPANWSDWDGKLGNSSPSVTAAFNTAITKVTSIGAHERGVFDLCWVPSDLDAVLLEDLGVVGQDLPIGEGVPDVQAGHDPGFADDATTPSPFTLGSARPGLVRQRTRRVGPTASILIR